MKTLWNGFLAVLLTVIIAGLLLAAPVLAIMGSVVFTIFIAWVIAQLIINEE